MYPGVLFFARFQLYIKNMHISEALSNTLMTRTAHVQQISACVAAGGSPLKEDLQGCPLPHIRQWDVIRRVNSPEISEERNICGGGWTVQRA